MEAVSHDQINVVEILQPSWSVNAHLLSIYYKKKIDVKTDQHLICESRVPKQRYNLRVVCVIKSAS